MEGLSRLVTESLARHGFDRPVDYRRLHWSRWFRCESPHSLLFVPSKPGIFVLAEEIMAPNHGGAIGGRRMLAVLQFCEDDDMAFVLDRMFSRQNPMRARLASGRCFVRFVALEDPAQRRSICNALNQWLISSTEATTGIGADFATSLELSPAADVRRVDDAQRTLFATAGTSDTHGAGASQAYPEPSRRAPRSEASGSGRELGFSASHSSPTAPQLDSGAAANLHCPFPFPSGF
jgi:hypothetical protein